MSTESVTRPAQRLRGLTHARTSFIGRSEAVSKVAALLDSYRLVTVTGPGGMGKTRLADEVLKQVADRFADGVTIAELGAVSDPALVAATVATVLEVHQAAGASVAEALAENLSRQQLLLVLDGCEHVLDAVAELCVVLLASADDITILATSREPLGLPEEARYRLPALALPGTDASSAAIPAEAVALFVARARQLDPEFTVDGDAGLLLSRLLKRLDGMPLAIELAAARVEALGLPQLLDRLDDRFRLLVSANRAVSARQRSLEATVDWSYQLLTEPEQLVFRRLATFPGPFTLDAAEAVAGTDAEAAVLRLVDCSLLVPPVTGPDGRSRYLMLETLRGYGLSRLEEAGELSEATAALAGHALRVAEQAAAQMATRGGEQPAARWLDAEDATVHQGLTWALDHDPAAALRLAVALGPWWLVRGRWIQGIGLLQNAVTQTGPNVGGWYTANVWLGHLARGTFDNDIALGHYSTVTRALRDGPPTADLVDSLIGRCSVLRNTGDIKEAAAEARNALELARRLGYATGEAMALTELGVISSYEDDVDRAVELASQAQLIDRDQMPGWFARRVEGALPFVLVAGGYRDGALELCVGALAQSRAAGDPSNQADVLYFMAVLARRAGELSEAQAHVREVVELARHAGYRMRLIDAVEEAGYWCATAGQHAAAVTLWAARDAQAKAAGLADTPAEEHAREQPLREAALVLGARQVRAAQERGAAMRLAAAAEFAIMMTRQHDPSPAAPPSQGKLSARERELITLVAQGQTDAQIAMKLFISVSTVRTHLDRIRDKSGCRRRADLTRLALQERII